MKNANASKTILFKCSHINLRKIFATFIFTHFFFSLVDLILIEVLLLDNLIFVEDLLLKVLFVFTRVTCFLLLHLLILVRLLLVLWGQHAHGCHA